MVMPIASAEPFLILEVEVGSPIDIGLIGAGARRLIPLGGGRVSGAIEGSIVPGGADWQTIHDDGNLQIEAHYAIRTRSGAFVEIMSSGVRTGPAEVLKRLRDGEVVDPSAYYFRTAIRFRSGAPEFAHLNFRLAVARGARRSDHVRLEVFEIL
jgi:hypothetical protein